MAVESAGAHLGVEELFRLYAGFVARFLRHLGVTSAELEDVVQDVFLVAHARGGYTAGPATPRSYLGSIALRAASSHRRRQRTERSRRQEAELDACESREVGPAAALETSESMDRVRGLLVQLDAAQRATLLLVDVEGESCVAVAASMQVPLGTVYWRLHKARALFRRAVQQQARGGELLTPFRKGQPS
jgi:RNA polymerase sigma-70 factor (ECF subfamily)